MARRQTRFVSRVIAARFGRSDLARESVIYAISTGVVALVAAASLAVLARNLSTYEFGSYAFALAFVLFVALFFEFGLFLPAARRMAVADSFEKRELAGAALVLFVPVGIAFCIAIAAFSFIVDPVFNVSAGDALLIAAPLSFGYPFALIGLLLAQGDGRIHLFSVTNAVGQLVFLAAVLAAATMAALDSVALPMVLRAAGVALAAALLAAWFRPVFHGVEHRIRSFVRDAREYGFQVYVGRVLSVATYNMDVLLLAALADVRTVAAYTIAVQLSTLAGAPVTGLGSAVFSRAASRQQIDPRWLRWSWAYGLVSAPLLFVLTPLLIEVVFSDRYSEAADLIVPLALAQALRGVTGIYNTYLASHAFGADLRNAAAILTVCNLVFNLSLIPLFGGIGAAWASFLALGVNLMAHVAFYRRSLRARKPAGAPQDPLLLTAEVGEDRQLG